MEDGKQRAANTKTSASKSSAKTKKPSSAVKHVYASKGLGVVRRKSK